MGGIEGLEAHYFWLALGLILAAAEMAIPGVFLIWMAAAALVTGAIAWLAPEIGMPWQIVMFAALAIAAVFTGRRYLRSHPVEAADPMMNDRGARTIGEIVTVTSVIDAGGGRVRLGDSEWMAKGPDAEPGTKMRVAAHDGGILIVEHLH